MVVLSGWFDGGRGRATGILLMASSLGGTVFPLIVGAGLLAWGWRDTATAMALGTGLIMLFSALVLLRDPKKRVVAATDTSPSESLGPTVMAALRRFPILSDHLGNGSALVRHYCANAASISLLGA